jgi:hypothetical protein
VVVSRDTSSCVLECFADKPTLGSTASTQSSEQLWYVHASTRLGKIPFLVDWWAFSADEQIVNPRHQVPVSFILHVVVEAFVVLVRQQDIRASLLHRFIE